MTAATLRNRISRLTDRLGLSNPDDCPGGPTIILRKDEPTPDDAGRCPLCGSAHVLIVEEHVSHSGDGTIDTSYT